MKRVLAIILVGLLLFTMAVPALAVTPSFNPPALPQVPEIKVDLKLPDDFWEKWFKDHPLNINIKDIKPTEYTEEENKSVPAETTSVVEELDTPIVSAVKYVHKTPYYGMRAHLEIDWDEIEGAEEYEVLITKADGETIEYTTDDTIIYDTTVKCPKVYVEKTNTSTSAIVKVRAICGDVVSEWSEPKNISCDMLHIV